MGENKVVSNAPLNSAMLPFDWINEDYADINNWKEIHKKAILQTGGLHNSFAPMFRAWCRYAIDHEIRYGSGIGEDYIIGKAKPITRQALPIMKTTPIPEPYRIS